MPPGKKTGVSLPRQHLVRVFRAPRFFLLPVCQSRRTNNGGDSAKRVFSLPKRSIPDSENRGDLAEIATSLNRIATIDRRSALRKKCNRADNRRHWVRAFRASRRYFPVSAVNYAEGITEATLPTRQPVEMFLPLLLFCPPAWSLPLKKKPRQLRQTGARADFWSATVPSLVSAQPRRESRRGDFAKQSTSLS